VSIKLMTAIFESPEPKGAERLVLLSLADNANDEGVCWPSVKTIAKKSAIDERRCHRIIKKLEKLGYLIITERNAANGINSTNVYAVYSTPIEDGTRARVAPAPPYTGTRATKGVAPIPPEPPFNPHLISSSINGDESNFQKVLKLYETYIGPIAGAFVGEQIDEALKENPFEWFEPAFRIAVVNNVRTWAYVKGILKNWKDHGFMADNRPVKSQGRGTFPRSGNGRHGLPPPPEGYEYDSSPAARPGTLIERQPRVHEVYTLEQVNEIRANVGKPPFTKEEYLNA
jgi:DnaD/phage-associated family protein